MRTDLKGGALKVRSSYAMFRYAKASANAPGHRIAAEDADLHGALASRVQVALRLVPCHPYPCLVQAAVLG